MAAHRIGTRAGRVGILVDAHERGTNLRQGIGDGRAESLSCPEYDYTTIVEA
ncbi:MAG TPA: hypothetical protein VJT49_20765 [Amycolatopsis sp.]|nr:hypothetical protein [Amycolatopsis sp.]